MRERRPKTTEMADHDGWADDPKSAVELLSILIGRKLRRGKLDDDISLPLDVAMVIQSCAIAGLYKGRGRGRPADSRGDKLRKQAIIAWARRRKIELSRAGGMKRTGLDSAEDLAAEEARKLAFERYGISLSVNTIKRMMQSSDI